MARNLFRAARPYLQPPGSVAGSSRLGASSTPANIALLRTGEFSRRPIKPPRVFWLQDLQERWLATRFDDGTNGYWIVCGLEPFVQPKNSGSEIGLDSQVKITLTATGPAQSEKPK